MRFAYYKHSLASSLTSPGECRAASTVYEGGAKKRESLHSSLVQHALILHDLLMRKMQEEITADRKLRRERLEAYSCMRCLRATHGFLYLCGGFHRHNVLPSTLPLLSPEPKPNSSLNLKLSLKQATHTVSVSLNSQTKAVLHFAAKPEPWRHIETV